MSILSVFYIKSSFDAIPKYSQNPILTDSTPYGSRIVITPKKLVEDKALQELSAVLKDVHAKNKGASEEEVVRYATQAISELREEEHAS